MLCLLEYLLTPATILRHAMLENAKTFSVHETGFEHKIYGWLCFCQFERSGKWGRIKKEFKIVLFYPSPEIEMSDV